MEKIRLNLASHPLRNRRFYRFCLGASAFLLVLTAFLGVFIYLKYGSLHRRAQSDIREIELQMKKFQSEERRFRAQADAAAKADKATVDFINAVIIRKTFSWTTFFTELEGALPEACYITSLAPTFFDQGRLALKVKVVSPNLDDLLSLINNLNARKFKKIRVQSEAFNDKGQLVSEITFDYERTL